MICIFLGATVAQSQSRWAQTCRMCGGRSRDDPSGAWHNGSGGPGGPVHGELKIPIPARGWSWTRILISNHVDIWGYWPWIINVRDLSNNCGSTWICRFISWEILGKWWWHLWDSKVCLIGMVGLEHMGQHSTNGLGQVGHNWGLIAVIIHFWVCWRLTILSYLGPTYLLSELKTRTRGTRSAWVTQLVFPTWTSFETIWNQEPTRLLGNCMD